MEGKEGSRRESKARTITTSELDVIVGNELPKILALLASHDDSSGRLHVERSGGVLDSLIDNLLDTFVGDGRFVGKTIVASSVLLSVLVPATMSVLEVSGRKSR